MGEDVEEKVGKERTKFKQKVKISFALLFWSLGVRNKIHIDLFCLTGLFL
jgi:hypothetical protein